MGNNYNDRILHFVKWAKKISLKILENKERIDKQIELYCKNFLTYFDWESGAGERNSFFQFYYINYFGTTEKRSVLICWKVLYEPIISIKDNKWNSKKISFYDYFLKQFRLYLDKKIDEKNFIDIAKILKTYKVSIDGKEYSLIELMACFLRIGYFYGTEDKENKSFSSNEAEIWRWWNFELCNEFIAAYDLYNRFWDVFSKNDYLLFYFGFMYFLYFLFNKEEYRKRYNDIFDFEENDEKSLKLKIYSKKLWISIENIANYLVSDCISWCWDFSLIDKFLPNNYLENNVKDFYKIVDIKKFDNLISRLLILQLGLYINKVENWYNNLIDLFVRNWIEFNLFDLIRNVINVSDLEKEKDNFDYLFDFFDKFILKWSQFWNVFQKLFVKIDSVDKLNRSLVWYFLKDVGNYNDWFHRILANFLKNFIIYFFVNLGPIKYLLNSWLKDYVYFKLKNIINLISEIESNNDRKNLLSRYILWNLYNQPVYYLRHSQSKKQGTPKWDIVSLWYPENFKTWIKVIIFHWNPWPAYRFLSKIQIWDVVVHQIASHCSNEWKNYEWKIVWFSTVEKVAITKNHDEYYSKVEDFFKELDIPDKEKKYRFEIFKKWEEKYAQNWWVVALCEVKLSLLENGYKPLNWISERWKVSYALNDLTWWEFILRLVEKNLKYI